MQNRKRNIVIILSLVAIGILTSFTYHKTQKSDINYYTGRKLFSKGKYKEAAKFYKKSLAISPDRVDALTDLGYSYQWFDDFKEAIEKFEKALSLKPEDDDLKIALAETYSWSNKHEKAINLYKEVLSVSDKPKVKKRLAEVYIWDKKPLKAKEMLESVLRDNPLDRKAKLLLAKAMHYSGETEKAVVVYEELLEKKEPKERAEKKEEAEEKELRGLLSEAYMISGDYEKAVREYEEILKNDPKNVKAMTG